MDRTSSTSKPASEAANENSNNYHDDDDELDPLKLVELKRRSETRRVSTESSDVKEAATEDEEEEVMDPLKLVELKRRAEVEPTKTEQVIDQKGGGKIGADDDNGDDDIDPLKLVELKRRSEVRSAAAPTSSSSKPAAAAAMPNEIDDGADDKPAAAAEDELDILKLVETRARQASLATDDNEPEKPAAATTIATISTISNAPPTITCANGKQRTTMNGMATSQPGAFAGAPGAGLERLSSLRYSQLERLNQSQVQELLASMGGDSKLALGDVKASIKAGSSRRVIDNNNTTQVDQTTGLFVARPITEESSRVLTQASFMGDLEQVHEEEQARVSVHRQKAVQSTMKWVCGGLIVLLVVILIIVFAVRGGGSEEVTETISRGIPGNSNSSSSSITSAPSLSIDGYITSLLPDHTLDEMRDESSPQSRAYQWLLNDTNLTFGGGNESFLSYPDWRIQQRLALATLYYATNGEEWIQNDNWLSYQHHECQWFAQPERPCVCKSGDDAIGDYIANTSDPCGNPMNEDQYTALRLSGNLLKGTLPEEVYMLTAITTLQLLHNELEGTISAEIGMLHNLSRVDLSRNAISGSIPTEIFSPIIRDFAMFGNSIAGRIPTEIGLATNLTNFFFDGTGLSGTIPSEIGLSESLVTLYLDSNALTGSIPTEFGLLSQLGGFVLRDNMLTSVLPSELGQLPNLWDVHVERNLLSSSIPSEFGLATNLWHIFLDGNQISSTIPTELGQLDPLFRGPCCFFLTFQFNQITGTIPTEIGRLSNLHGLRLTENNLSSTIPSVLGNLSNMKWLYLADTDLTGPIPTEFGQMTSLEKLYLQDNHLSGVVIESMRMLAGNITELDISNNTGLVGVIPEDLCFLNETLLFDCSPDLCGCSWCECPGSNSSGAA